MTIHTDQLMCLATRLSVGWLDAQSLRNKADSINIGIVELSLDILAVTET